jgi:hypothetical protein
MIRCRLESTGNQGPAQAEPAETGQDLPGETRIPGGFPGCPRAAMYNGAVSNDGERDEMVWFKGWVTLAVATTTMAAAAWAGEPVLLTHRAVYAMSLASTQPGSGIAGATGTMTYQFSDSCDGWVVENRIAVTYSYTEGGQSDTTTDFLTWESKDGLKYRFRLRGTRDGQTTDDVEGTADLHGKRHAGEARYTRPRTMTIPLPPGTLFPTEHTVRLLDAARSDQRMLYRILFDGSDTEGPYDVSALIGHARAAEGADAANPLLNAPSWPMRLAFYPVHGSDPTPDFEMTLDYLPNGVSRTIVQSFKNFSLQGQLSSLKALPRKGC